MLLCKKCGYLVKTVEGTITRARTVSCINPRCKLTESFSVDESDDPKVDEFIAQNCEDLKLDNAIDRRGKIKDLLWWIEAQKKMQECPLTDPALVTVTAAVEDVIAAYAHNIAVTLRRRNDA